MKRISRDVSKTVADSKQLLQSENKELQTNREQFNEKLQQLRKASESLKEREDKIKIAEENLDLLKQQLLEKERELKEKEDDILSLEKRFNTTIIPSTKQVRLNIGGKKYYTSIDTLTAEKNTFFSGMCGSYKPSRNGEYFIDRDGTLFYIILNHLRGYSTKQTISNLGFAKKQRLVEDLKFYGIGHWCCETCQTPCFTSPPPDMKCCYDWVCTRCKCVDELHECVEPPEEDYLCSYCTDNREIWIGSREMKS